VLTIGLPLWAVLSPQQRVALLGHELGHFVNGDVRYGLLTQIPARTCGELAELLRPAPTGAGDLVIRLLFGPLHVLAATMHVLLRWLSHRDGHHAEYLADHLAARAAGPAAATELADLISMSDPVTMLIKRDARAGLDLTGWRTSLRDLLTQSREHRTVYRQRSIRDEVSICSWIVVPVDHPTGPWIEGNRAESPAGPPARAGPYSRKISAACCPSAVYSAGGCGHAHV
jgi:hypothetical protein